MRRVSEGAVRTRAKNNVRSGRRDSRKVFIRRVVRVGQQRSGAEQAAAIKELDGAASADGDVIIPNFKSA
jgi:hypothetical protein